jgi:hypothetical protein
VGQQWRKNIGRLALLGAVAAFLVAAILPMITAPSANAAPTTLYSQLNNGAWRSVQGSSWLAESFTTSADPTAVTDVSIVFRNATENNGSSNGSSVYSVSIWSSSSGVPGAQLTSVATSVQPGAWSEGTQNYTLPSPLSLTASTEYFVVMTGTGTMGWKCNPAAPTSNVSPAPTFSALSSSDSGSNWSALSGTCAGQNFGLSVTGATAATPALSNFSNVNATVGDPAQSIVAPTADTAGTFSYASSNPAVASVNGTQLSFVAAGTAQITATFTPTDTLNYTSASIVMTATVATPAPTTTTTVAPPPPAPTTTTTTEPPQTTSTSTTIVEEPTTTVAPTTTTPAPTTTTTAAGVVPTPGFAEPSAHAPSNDIFGDTEGEQVAVTIDASIGDPSRNAPVQIRAVALAPNAKVTVTVYSEPQVLLTGTADGNGVFEATTYLPATLESGRHTVVAETTAQSGPVEVAGAFTLDDSGAIDKLAQPAVLTGFVGPSDARLTRALDLERPVWDVAARPLTTAAIAVSGIALLGIAGAVGLSGAPSTVGGMGTATSGGDGESSGSSSGQRKRNARGKLSGVVTKKLKGIQIESTARGDLSSTWAMPGTARADAFSRSVPAYLGRYSAAAPRVFVDGAWLRAIFGSFGFLTWGIGLGLGIVAAFVDTLSPLTPAYPLLLAMIVLGILDAAAGAVAWITLVVIALVTGNIAGWPDIRTAMGLGILLATISLLAHVIRPLRRYVAKNASEAWERFFDYVMMPVFVAFASGSALKALNGLSGLQIVSSSQVSTMRWVVGIAIILRLACEDIASHWYPERMIMVQPAKLVSPGRTMTSASIVIRTLVFLMIAEPFFGLTATTVLAAVLLAIPVVMKMWEDDLPNSGWLNKWLPRGLFRFLCMLILGMYLTAVFIGKNGGDSAIKSSFIWLLLPGVVVGVIELFARFGGEWPNVTVRRSLGAVVWVTAASLVTGYLILFI